MEQPLFVGEMDHGTSQEEIQQSGSDPSLDQYSRIRTKEKAAAEYSKRLKKISKMLNESSIDPESTSLGPWVSVYKGIEKERKGLEFMAGIVGDSGMGKSSLVNALLSQTSDIAPTSQSGACTAAVCCFRYNKSADPDEAFRATIRLKNRETVEHELNAFFQEFKDFEDENSLAGLDEFDSVVQAEKQRFQQQLKVICGWSGLEADEVRSYGLNNAVSEITQLCVNSAEIFNTNYQTPLVKTIVAATGPAFLKSIKPYIGSAGNQSQRLLWPLVEIVDIFVKVPLLRPGIVLVDLPGESDALEARSQVARQYYNRVDLTMVVTPCDRAADNRTAVELLREDQILDLEADAKLDGRLAVVITKIDQLDWRSFVENEWAPEDISAEFPQMMKTLIATKRKLRMLDTKLDGTDSNVYGSDNESDDDHDGSGGSDSNMENDAEALKSQQLQLRAQCTHLEAQCISACVQARSQADRQKFQQVFDTVRAKVYRSKDGLQPSQLSVLPVSSKAQRGLLKKNPWHGFPDKKATGFQALEDWIVQASLKKREEHADHILLQYAGLFDALSSWIEDGQQVSSRLPASDYEGIKETLDHESASLKENLFKSHKGLLNHLKRGGNPIKDMREDSVSKKLANGFKGHVDSYEKGTDNAQLHWASYAALIRRSGGTYKTSSRPRKSHDWQSRMYTYYWGFSAKAWHRAFHLFVPKYIKTLQGGAQAKISDHIRRIQISEGLPPEFKHELQAYIYRIENAMRCYQTKLNEIGGKYRSEATIAKQSSRIVMAQGMEPGYNAAQAIHGKNKYRRQRLALSEHAEAVSDTIFLDVTDKIDAGVEAARKNFIHRHYTLVGQTASLINKIMITVAQRICDQGQKPFSKGKDKGTKALKEMIGPEVNAWVKRWESLRAKLPGFKIELLTEEQLEALDRDENEPEARVKKPRKAKNVAPAGLVSQKPKKDRKRKAEPEVKTEDCHDEQPSKIRKIGDQPGDDETALGTSE